ncbi:Polyadenylate-binding protein [Quillaja saponaria]|uniref:Polyadenylate-binding protein n=1 Tax=Quillaja saponaria TaxID=32244 RepID=A0AAD7LYH3_QUISA|nr:Polyadenylate-binding protein [Quillaja saponaria]KAJ7966594.1 Polyadenylate-binding protein [Quillaja saponaria]
MAQIQVQHQSPVSSPNSVATTTDANQFGTTSLYVGDLDQSVNDSQLYDVFSQIGSVISVRVCVDLATRRSLGYGYVNFSSPQDAARALEVLNFTPLNNKPIRIMYSHRDPTIRKSGTANIFIKNLEKSIDHKALHETFSSFGNILSCKLATDASGQSKGYGFVQFDNDESAQNAIDKLNGMLINEKQVYVGRFLRKQERESVSNKTKFNNVYVKNLSELTTDAELNKIFGEYGTITSAVIMRDADDKSKGFGFVNFESADDAAKAVEELNGKKVDEKEWYVGKAMKKSERELELKGWVEQSMKEVVDQGLNLYVKNLDDTVGDEKLKELFSEFGTITSGKVMLDPNGISRGSGFVAFSTPEEASRAITEMNGKMVDSKPLYVAIAQRKEERRARLQAQFSHMRPVAMAPSVGPRIPMYPTGAPALGQQFLYGQAPPAMIPPHAGFGYQQQIVPGMRPGSAQMPNFFIPMVQQGQQGQHPGGRRGAGPVQQSQLPVPLMQQQVAPRGRVYRYPPVHNMQDIPNPVPGVGGGMPSVPYDMSSMPMQNAAVGRHMPIQALATALANSPPYQQRTMLGEALYPLVDQLEHEAAAKITGMLLEMDQTEVLHLIESPDDLKAKVAEAMDVLRNVAQQQVNSPVDQLASLSLNENPVSQVR